MQLPNWILQWSTDQSIAVLQTIVGAAGLFGLYWQLRKANQVSKAESYVTIRATLASLNQTIIDNTGGRGSCRAFLEPPSNFHAQLP